MPSNPSPSDAGSAGLFEGLGGVTLAILAGGEGSRMGRPKGLLEINGVPILTWILGQLRWPGPTMVVTAPGRERPPGWELFDRETTDPIAGLGPLRGITTALEAATTDRTIILPVDMPFMNLRALTWLAHQPAASGVLLRNGGDAEEQIEPMPLLVLRSALPTLLRCLEEKRIAVRGLALEPGFSVVTAPADWEDQVWQNLNFRDDLPR
jgi:molybdopterin-guanine dinucleotide biosynthesis protein A